MKNILLFVLALCFVYCAFASNSAVCTLGTCNSSPEGPEGPVQAVTQAVDEEEEEEESMVLSVNDFLEYEVPVLASAPFYALPKPPVVIANSGSVRINDMCYSGCTWYQFDFSNGPICSNCANLLSYPVPTINGTQQCYSVPRDVSSGLLTPTMLQTLKGKCAASGCICTSTQITSSNANNIILFSKVVNLITDTYIEFFSTEVERFSKHVESTISKNKKKCAFAALALLGNKVVTYFSKKRASEISKAIGFVPANFNATPQNVEAKLKEITTKFNDYAARVIGQLNSQSNILNTYLKLLCRK